MTAALVIGIATFVACGGSGNGGRIAVSVEEYFRLVEEADATAEARFDNIEAQLGEDLPEEEALLVLKEVFPQQIATLRDLLERFEVIEPPAELREVHEDAVDALRQMIDTSEETAEAIEGADALRELQGVFAREEASRAADRLAETCIALEQAAEGRGVPVDLDC